MADEHQPEATKLVREAVREIRRRWPVTPQLAMVLGTGLGPFADRIDAEAMIPYCELPGFAQPTALAHHGRLICGHVDSVPVMLMQGRCHVYEGYTFEEITLPIRVLEACGARTLIATNAAGGLSRHLATGDLLVLADHINLLSVQRSLFGAMRGCEASSLIPRHRAAPLYDPDLIALALSVARQHRFPAHEGVYAAVPGPNYETRAEYLFLRNIGADVVGMSTVPEVLVAAELGMRTLGLSIVTNVAHTESPEAIDAWHVVSAAERAEPHVRSIVEAVIQSLAYGEAPLGGAEL